MKKHLPSIAILVALSVMAFANILSSAQTGGSRVTRMEFGKLPDGRAIDQFTLSNSNGLQIQAITYGAIITSIRVPDRNGKLDDVVLGYDTLAPYVRNPSYFGAIVGRYANRIANGRFTLEGKTIRWPRTTDQTTCTAARRDSTSSSGMRRRAITPAEPRSRLLTAALMGKKDSQVRSMQRSLIR
jgi:hypothetical protein